jgi:D-alanine-D-alanine ligase
VLFMVTSSHARRVLILWNQVDEDIYEIWQRHGPEPLPWAPHRTACEVGTVREEMDALVAAVRQGGYEVMCINARDDVERIISALRLYRPDVVFNLVEYFHDDETMELGVVGLYELFGVPYTGSRPHALTLCQRKDHAKLILASAGLPTSPFFVIEHLDTPVPDPEALGLAYPLIVKPALEDASGGIEPASVVTDLQALEERVALVLTEFEQPALVERYIEGREIHAAILGNDPPRVLPLFEMAFDDSEFNPTGEWRPQIVSYEAKWDPLSEAFYSIEPVCPAAVEDELARRIHAIALRAYQVMGCRDYARIDMRIDRSGQPYILEVNPNPDLAEGSAFVMCALASGRSYSRTLSEILDMAARRGAGEGGAAEPAPESTDALTRKYRQRM